MLTSYMRMQSGWKAPAVVLTAAFVLVAGLNPLWAADADPVSVNVGKMEVVDVAFPIRGFRVADPTIAKVESQGAQQLRVLGLKTGSTDLQVTGDGSVSAFFTLNVGDNINAVLAAVKRDLDTVPEVDISLNLGRVMLKGEISNVQHWKYLQKVINLYKGSVANLVTFQPAPEVMLSLKTSLEKAGLKIQGAENSASTPAPGTLALRYAGNSIFISGSVYSPKDKERVVQIIDSQNWLTLQKPKDDDKGDESQVRAILDLNIIPTMLELDVMFVGVTEAEEKQIGVNLAKAGLLSVDSASAAFQGTLGHGASAGFGGGYTINSGLKGALTFFSGSGPGRFQSAGHMTFKNDAPDWKTYHSGGTLKVRVASRDVASLQDIDYGLMIKVKGGLLDAQTAAVDLNLELSNPEPSGADYNVVKNHLETTVNCPIGQTMVLAGMKKLVEKTSTEGVPFLRSVPVISWLFSEKNRAQSDSTVLILISPQLAGGPTASRPVSEQTMPALEQSGKPVGR